jgi:hypothetical protein
MRPVQPSVVATRHHVMLSAVPSSSIVNSVIRITGIGDHDRLEWLIRISGIRIRILPSDEMDRHLRGTDVALQAFPPPQMVLGDSEGDWSKFELLSLSSASRVIGAIATIDLKYQRRENPAGNG